MGRFSRVRRYRDAQVAVTTYTNRWGRTSVRLFIVDQGGRHFFLERLPAEGIAVADLVCGETGWKRVDVPFVSSTGLDGFTT